MPYGDVKVEAEFEATEDGLTLTLDPNGGVVPNEEEPPQTVYVYSAGTDENTVPENPFIKEGHDFSRWNTLAKGNGTDYEAEADLDLTKLFASSASVTLYAQWTPQIYTVTFDQNLETVEKIAAEVDGAEDVSISGKMTEQSFTYGVSQALSANKFQLKGLPGYKFVGWNTERDGSGNGYLDKASVSATGDMTLYAQWAVGNFTVTFDPTCPRTTRIL